MRAAIRARPAHDGGARVVDDLDRLIDGETSRTRPLVQAHRLADTFGRRQVAVTRAPFEHCRANVVPIGMRAIATAAALIKRIVSNRQGGADAAR